MSDRTAKTRVLVVTFGDIVVDLSLPTLIYLTLRTTGLPVPICLTIGGFVVAAKAGAGRLAAATAIGLFYRRPQWRRLDRFALLVMVELATSIVLVIVSDDPRFVLVRPSFYTATAGVFALWTVVTPRPLMIDASKPMAVAGNRARAVAFERAARESPRFLATERL